MAFASTLKSVKSSSDRIENKESICLVKSVNIPLEKESLIFIEEYLSTIHVVMMFSVREYTSSVVHRMPKDIMTNQRID